MSRSTDEEFESTLRHIGREAVGPAFCVYLHRVIERAHSLQLERLLFLAREGFVFRSLYERLGGALPTSYLYVSRLSTALPAVHRFGLRELRIASRRVGERTPRDLLRTFGLDEGLLLPRMYEAGFRSATENILEWWGDTRFDRLIEDEVFQALVRQQADAARARLRRYLEHEGYFAQRVGLVDVGWGGTIQDALARAFRDESTVVHGLYFGLGEAAERNGDPLALSAKEGLFADFRRHTELPQRAIFAFVELFEQSARAPHGTTIGYVERDGSVVPRLKEAGLDRDAERGSEPLIAALQEGIAEAAEIYVRTMPRRADERMEAAWSAVDRVVYLPTQREVRAISSLAHTVDWGGDGHMKLGASTRLPLHPGKLKRQFDSAFWKSGFLRGVGGPVLPLLYRRYLGHKRS